MPTRRLLAGIAAIPFLNSSSASVNYAPTFVTRAFTPWIASLRHASSSRWQARQSRDQFAREAKVQGLKSRAAFKLLQLNQKYRLFKPGNTVIDLGYAPGSWSQVAADRTAPGGRVVGVDVIPAQPPRGVSTIQGNFLSPAIQAEVRAYVQDPRRGRPLAPGAWLRGGSGGAGPDKADDAAVAAAEEPSRLSGKVPGRDGGYVDRASAKAEELAVPEGNPVVGEDRLSVRERDETAGRVVDVVLNDMCEPWDQTTGFWHQSISDPYRRMMNTSGTTFRDHAGSMDLCMAALTFCFDTLRTGGHFVCKFYQGSEDKALEQRLKKLFEKVHRDKPESSRKESKEAYFVALRRKESPSRDEILS